MILTKFDSKQKMLLAAFVVILLVLAWQSYELFRPVEPNIPRVIPAHVKTTMPTQAGIQAKAVMPAQVTSVMPAQAGIQNNTGAPAAIDTTNSNNQNQYLRLINEYQMAQVQRMIAEDNEAIAVAKRNAAQALTDTSKLVGGDVSSLSANSDDSSSASGDYVLVYTGQQDDGSWTATLKKGGQSYDVTPSQALPDGSKVLSIDENGVVLLQGKTKKLVTFSGVMQSAGASTSNDNDIPNGDDNTQTSDADAQASVQSSTTDQVNANAPVPKPAPTPAAPVAQPKIPAMTANKPLVTPTAKPAVKDAAKAVVSTPATPPVTTTAPATTTPAATPAQTAAAAMNNLNNQEDAAIQLPLPVETKASTPAVSSAPAAEQPAKINSKGYTIILSTNKKLISATGFIKDNKLDKNAQYLHVVSNDGDQHYVVVYGQYDTKQAAQKALQALPETVKVEGAYVTSMATLKPVTN